MHFLFDKLSSTTIREIDEVAALLVAAVILVVCFLSWRSGWDD